MRLGLVTCSAALLLGAVLARPAPAQRAPRGDKGARRAVQITESSAVVFALECPSGAQPIWQPVSVFATVALPELGWLGLGHTRICGVEVRGSDTQVILACQRADGTQHGPVGTWYPSGEKRTEGYCESGVANGWWRRYRRDGWLELEGRYERGSYAAGTWMTWPPVGDERALSPADLRRDPPVF